MRQQHDYAQGRERELERLCKTVIRLRVGHELRRRCEAAAAESLVVAVERVSIRTRRWCSDPIPRARNRREIEHHDRVLLSVEARVREHRLFLVGNIDPRES